MDYTIEQMESSMTIFFSKSSGAIKSLATGIQSMDMFGEDKGDFSIIWDYVLLTKDDYVLNNYKQFKINLETKTLEIIPGAIPDYPVAQS